MKNKIKCFLLTILFALNLSAIDLPALSNVLGIKIFMLPKEVNKEVLFTFTKKDNNGRAGSDALAFSVISPSGKTVFEYTIPDDGNAENGWKFGPKQPVEVRFVPKEKGVYTLEFKMECDAYLYFDNTKIKNLHVGFTNGNFRTGSKSPIHVFFYLPIDKVGEAGVTHISSNYMHYSQISDMIIKTDKEVFYNKFTAKPAPDRKKIFTHNFLIPRKDPNALYELSASKFGVISFAPRLYPVLKFFLTKEAAVAFKPYLFKSNIYPNSFALSAKEAVKSFALGAGQAYKVNFEPENPKDNYNFTVQLLGKTYTFKRNANGFVVDVPKNNAFPSVKISGKADGKFVFSRVVVKEPEIELPVNGSVICPEKGNVICKALTVKNAKKYNFVLTHEAGTKLQYNSTEPIVKVPAEKLLPGVWQVWCAPVGGKAGAKSCFSIKQPQDTTPVFAYNFTPVTDGTVKTYREISLKVLCSADKIDLIKTNFVINKKAYKVAKLGKDKIGILANKLNLPKGKVDIIANIYDKFGNYSRFEWCFILNANIHKTISFNKDGILIFNGRKFLPLICYPPLNNGTYGFNTTLPNALSTVPQLDVYLRNNMKSLDGGCVYRGFYTPKGSTPLQDVNNFMKGKGGSHPARIGAWMDESDAHVPDAYAKKIIDAFRVPDCGVAGVCTTGRSRYSDMAKLGDYLMIDIYPRANVLGVDYYFAKALRDAAGKPVWQLNQGFDYDWGNRDESKMIPNPSMLKYAHWSAFRHGLQGLGIYMCGSTKYWNFPKLWACLIDLYRQANTLSFVLVEPSVKDNIVSVKAPLKSRVIRYGNRYYLIIQNASLKPFAAAVNVKGKFNSKVKVLFENRTVQLKNGKFNDVFQAIESRIYELTEK